MATWDRFNSWVLGNPRMNIIVKDILGPNRQGFYALRYKQLPWKKAEETEYVFRSEFTSPPLDELAQRGAFGHIVILTNLSGDWNSSFIKEITKDRDTRIRFLNELLRSMKGNVEWKHMLNAADKAPQHKSIVDDETDRLKSVFDKLGAPQLRYVGAKSGAGGGFLDT